MKRLVALVMIGTGLSLHAELEVSDVQVFSGRPWREVAIGYTITGTMSESRCLHVNARDNTTGRMHDCTLLTGASVEPGRHVLKWNAYVDSAKFKSDDVVFTVQVVSPPPLYCVIDLSGGKSATNYPVSELADIPSGGWTDEYKTTKLVLRRIEAGSFKMQNQYDVTLTKPFYIGVFEVTQKQYELVMGANPSYYKGDMRPVEEIDYDMIRGSSAGAGWPANNAVDENSFLGKLRMRTGIELDLPTEAQWEYACRAGTTSDYNNGGSSESDLAELGRYYYNQNDGRGGYIEAHTKVGSYLPNAWGLYDMHGNVCEQCLDWCGDIVSAVDPVGPSPASLWILWRGDRGGSWFYNADSCTSVFRGLYLSGTPYYGTRGFRLSMPLQDVKKASDGKDSMKVLAGASSGSMVVDTTFVEGCEIPNLLTVAYGNPGTDSCRVEVDETLLIESADFGTANWWTGREGLHTLAWQSAGCAMTTKVDVVNLEGPPSPIVSPTNGMTFTSSLTVSMSSPMENAAIYYTLDGSEPTIESTSYKKFKISGKTTVKAVAYREGLYSDVVIASYALGRCSDPIILPPDGTMFDYSEQVVTIDKNGVEGVLRYTIDGTEPTAESPVYAEVPSGRLAAIAA